MKLLKYIHLIFITLIISNQAFSDDNLKEKLKGGGKIIFIRHAYAPGVGDPDNFSINDCSTQRNLNKEGIEQSKKIGKIFKNNFIEIDKIFSSEWCRCKDTAFYAFKKYKTFSALNSFYDPKFEKKKNLQIKQLQNYIKKWTSNKNLVLITHYVVISEILGIGVSSGEIIISDKDFNILFAVETR